LGDLWDAGHGLTLRDGEISTIRPLGSSRPRKISLAALSAFQPTLALEESAREVRPGVTLP
jgi:hypothetical protein